MANRKRKYPGIKGRRPDKKFARAVRAKSSSMTFVETVPLALPNKIINPNDVAEEDYNHGLMIHINTGSWEDA